jgi:hypothetical protein
VSRYDGSGPAADWSGRTAIYYRKDSRRPWSSLGSCGSPEAARMLMFRLMGGGLSGDWTTGPAGHPPQRPRLG